MLPVPLAAVMAAGVLCLALVRVGSAGSWKRWALVVPLEAGATAALVLAVLRPGWTVTLNPPTPPRSFVLSEEAGTGPGPTGLAALPASDDVLRLSFSGAGARGGAPALPRSIMLHGLREAMRRAVIATGGRPASALLVLKGEAAVSAAPSVAARLGRLGATVSAVAGLRPRRPEVRVGGISVSPRMPRAGGTAVAEAEIETDLPTASSVAVRWSLDGRTLARPPSQRLRRKGVLRSSTGTKEDARHGRRASREIARPAGRVRGRVEQAFAVPTGGLHRLRVEAMPLEGERDRADNAAGIFFRAAPGSRRVLMAEGPPREVTRRIRRSLETYGAFDVSASSSIERPRSAPVLPRAGSAWEAIDLVVLGDLAAHDFLPGSLERLVRFVKGGGGLVVVAGPRNLGRGGLHRTPVAEVLPVASGPDDGVFRGPWDARPAGPVGAPRPFPFGRGWAGLLSVERRVPDDFASWRDLPELDRVFEVEIVRPRARISVTAVGPGRRLPLVVDGPAGRGRVTVVLSDDLPRWARSGPRCAASHDEFWRELALAAARASAGEGPRVWLETPPGPAFVGEGLRVTAYLADPGAELLFEVGLPAAPSDSAAQAGE
jgi:uncharacterized membrane protein